MVLWQDNFNDAINDYNKTDYHYNKTNNYYH
jgi:hypothetical protein